MSSPDAEKEKKPECCKECVCGIDRNNSLCRECCGTGVKPNLPKIGGFISGKFTTDKPLCGTTILPERFSSTSTPHPGHSAVSGHLRSTSTPK
jgi:hypothetical protein